MSFVEYINLEDCPNLYEIVINIILTRGEQISEEETMLIENVFSRYKVDVYDLSEMLTSSTCFLEYLDNIKNGNFVEYVIQIGEEITDTRFKSFIQKVKNSPEYFSKLFFNQFKCETLYIYNEIVTIEETAEKVLMGNDLINNTIRECFTCGKNLRTDLLFYMLYNGILKETIMEIYSASIAEKMCCKRTITNNIDLILEPYVNPVPLTRKYVIDDDLNEKIIETNTTLQGVPNIGNWNTDQIYQSINDLF